MHHYKFNLISIILSLFAFTFNIFGQQKIQIRTNTTSNSLSVTAINPPKNGIVVIWRSNSYLDNTWEAIHSFPTSKHETTELNLKPKTDERAFFKLSWQPINLPDRLIWIAPGKFLMGSPMNLASLLKKHDIDNSRKLSMSEFTACMEELKLSPQDIFSL